MLFPHCNLWEQGGCGAWGGSWKALERVGNKTDIGRGQEPGVRKEDVNGDLREASTSLPPPALR